MEADRTPFDAILMMIVAGKIKSGDRLVERDLGPRLGVSRTPVREAIRKLESLGLVGCSLNKGAVVTELSPADIESLYFLRLFLERLTARLSFYNLGQEKIAALREINGGLKSCLKKADNTFDLIDNDRMFHDTIYEASGNRYLIGTINDLRLKASVIAYYAWRDRDRVRASIEEHSDIIRALERKDRARFEMLLEHQLVSAKTFYLEHVQ